MEQLPVYKIRAINDALTSENKIHSDEIARKFGFTGALVSGVSVYGYLTYPLVEAFGEDWFSSTIAEVKFLKPAYADDLLTIRSESIKDSGNRRHYASLAFNEAGQLLARLDSWRQESQPSSVDPAIEINSTIEIVREEISFEKIKLNQPSIDYEFEVSQSLHMDCLAIMRDDLVEYHQNSSSLVHPYYLLKECNQALMRMFILPAWIHVGSHIVFHRPIRLNQTVKVKTVPTDKWERKGHQFIKLCISMLVAEKVVMEVEHTAIFRISDS
jgi:acyl dehydratase